MATHVWQHALSLECMGCYRGTRFEISKDETFKQGEANMIEFVKAVRAFICVTHTMPRFEAEEILVLFFFLPNQSSCFLSFLPNQSSSMETDSSSQEPERGKSQKQSKLSDLWNGTEGCRGMSSMTVSRGATAEAPASTVLKATARENRVRLEICYLFIYFYLALGRA